MNDASPAEWTVQDAAALARGRALLRYADAVLFTVDEPPEGGRLPAATLLLASAVEALTIAVEPGFTGSSSEHPFWKSLGIGELPAPWSALASKQPLPSQEAVLAVRRLAWAGAAKLEGPGLVRTRKSVVRVLKVAAVLLALGALVAGGLSLARNRPPKPGLLQGKPFRTSSSLGRGSGSDRLLFHTELDGSPWVEYDLLQRTRLHEVVVVNRSDCCDERALPLLVEVSDDRAQWTELTRRTEPFARVTLPFPEVEARYLRLRVDKSSYLHLEAVEAH